MRLLPLVLSSAALAVSAGTVVALVLGPGPRGSDRLPHVPSAELAAVHERLTALEERVDELARSIAALQEAPARTRQGTREPLLDVDAAVARWMEQHPERGPAARTGTADGKDEQPLDAALAALLETEAEGTTREALLRQLRMDGRLDEVIGRLEEQAGARPGDPGVQVALGQAYIEKIQGGVDAAQAGTLATGADRAFDRALELDPQNADARYTKALALTFWPPAFGRQGDAIAQFEVLAQQASASLSEERQHSTYLLLGNMYEQLGKREEARLAWQRGLALFPDDADLLRRLQSQDD